MIFGKNNTASTYRMAVASKETYSGTPTLSGVDCYIEPIDPKIAAIFDSQNAFSLFKMFVDGGSDIQISDKVVDSEGNTYIVLGVQDFNDNLDVENSAEITMTKKYAKN